eukprot:768272-Hanusia_phi.AAC.2
MTLIIGSDRRVGEPGRRAIRACGRARPAGRSALSAEEYYGTPSGRREVTSALAAAVPPVTASAREPVTESGGRAAGGSSRSSRSDTNRNSDSPAAERVGIGAANPPQNRTRGR